MTAKCEVCPHGCTLSEGQYGLCRARLNEGGRVIPASYGMITSMALDPIEKKPLYHFTPGSMILSVGSFGCNLSCGFCQNHEISMAGKTGSQAAEVSPVELAARAKSLVPRGNIGIAYTYNEPLINFEYVRDCSFTAHGEDLLNVLVTNGYVREERLAELLPYIDAMNIDLKGFTDDFYRKVGGGLETVKHTIELSAKSCHVEVTTLIIPGENDSHGEMRELSSWLSSISNEIPLHISRFFPRYKYSTREPTRVETIYALREVARENLKYVYTGNC